MSRSIAVALSLALTASLAIVPAVTVAADPAECVETSVEENIALVEAYVGHQGSENMEGIDASLDDDHTGMATMGATEMMGTNEDEHAIAMAVEMTYPGSTYRIDEILGVDDKVVVEATLIVPAHMLTGEMVEMETPVEAHGIAIYTIGCGQIQESSVLLDTYGLLVGLGLLPAPQMPAAG